MSDILYIYNFDLKVHIKYVNQTQQIISDRNWPQCYILVVSREWEVSETTFERSYNSRINRLLELERVYY